MDKVVGNDQNPCKAVWDEYNKTHKINLEQMNYAIYSVALSDPECDYRFRMSPVKPNEMQMDEMRFKKAQNEIQDDVEKRKAYAKFQEYLKTKYKSYLADTSSMRAFNSSNLYFVTQIHDFFKESNIALAAKAREIIKTHEMGIYSV